MRNHFPRKTTPKQIGGKPTKKNNHKPTPNYWNTFQDDIIIDQKKPGLGYKHFLKKRDVIQFLELLPNKDHILEHMDAIILDRGHPFRDGVYYNNGVISLHAWSKEMDIECSAHYYSEHKDLFDRLGISATLKDEYYTCEFNEDQIKAYQLLHILTHELGHHIDRMLTKRKFSSARGEAFAEDMAYYLENKVWNDYQTAFNVIFIPCN